MGIRFYCPNGHKLNVKEFQAGKKGICPYCGAKIRIPLESTRKSSRELAEDPEMEVVGGDVDLPEALPAMPEPAATSQVAAQQPVAQTQQPQAPVQPQQPVVQQPVQPQQPVQQPIPEQPVAPIDPLAEAPGAVWYVRPVSGGQFGPASADVMRQWLVQGRISGDSLVWREGWPDWLDAGVVFPQLSSGSPKAPPVEPPAQVATQAPSYTQMPVSPQQPVSPYPIRRRSNSSAIIVVVLLSVLVITLITVFVIVLSRRDSQSSAPRGNRPVRAAVARIEFNSVAPHASIFNSCTQVGKATRTNVL